MLHYDPAEHDTPPLTEARIARSWLEQTCAELRDNTAMGALNLLVGAALVCLAGGAAALWSGWL